MSKRVIVADRRPACARDGLLYGPPGPLSAAGGIPQRQDRRPPAFGYQTRYSDDYSVEALIAEGRAADGGWRAYPPLGAFSNGMAGALLAAHNWVICAKYKVAVCDWPDALARRADMFLRKDSRKVTRKAWQVYLTRQMKASKEAGAASSAPHRRQPRRETCPSLVTGVLMRLRRPGTSRRPRRGPGRDP